MRRADRIPSYPLFREDEMNVKLVLLILAILMFLLALFAAAPFGLNPIALGLVFFAASFLPI